MSDTQCHHHRITHECLECGPDELATQARTVDNELGKLAGSAMTRDADSVMEALDAVRGHILKLRVEREDMKQHAEEWEEQYDGARAILAHRDRELAALAREKDGAYAERNKLVTYLAAVFPSALTRTVIPGWDPEWEWCVCMTTPKGQMSWHIHDSELPLFDHVELVKGWEWDGHTTEEKYERLAELIKEMEGEG